MDITIATSELRAALSRVQGITGGKTGTLPVLSCVLLDATVQPEGGRLTAKAYDLESGLVSVHPCDIKKPGSVAVPAKALNDIAKLLPELTVRLKVGTNNRLEVSSGASSFKLAGFAAEDFPAMPEPVAAGYETAARVELLSALEAVAFAMSQDETRYNLNGVFAEGNADGLTLAATDGHRLSVFNVEGGSYNLPAGEGVIVSRKAVHELRKLLAEESAAPAELAFSVNTMAYRRAGVTYMSRLVDGSFPAYQKVIPEESKQPVFARRASLLEVLKRVLLMAADVSSAVHLSLADGKLTVTARNADVGEASDELAVEYAGETVKLALNGRYLLDMLMAAEGDQLLLSMTGDTDPVLVRPVGSQAHLYVLMPVRA